jgi:hypothetical protein
MNFLYPAFLWSLLAASVPVIIHLFNFRRTRKVAFTNVAFLKTVQVSTQSFRRLKQWLVLAMRVLFLVMLVLAFAQPFIQRNHLALPGGKGVTGIYLDNSLSMQNQSANVPHLDIAASQAEQLISTLPDGMSYQLMTNDFENSEQFLSSREKAIDRLREIKFSNRHRSAENIARREQNLLHGQTGNRFFWLSDFQKSTTGELEKIRLDTTGQYFLVPVQTPETSNLYVDSVWLSVPFIQIRQPNTLHVSLFNTGKEKIENRPVKFFIDNQQVATATITLNGNSGANVAFTFTVQEKGYRQARISFEDAPIVFDNDYFLVLNAAPLVNVLHLYSQPEHSYIDRVFASPGLFSLHSASIAALDPAAVQSADLVVIDEAENLSSLLVTALQTHLRRGGSVVAFPAANANLSDYNRLLLPAGVRNPEKMSGNATALAFPDVNNPFFYGVFENSIQRSVVDMPKATPLLTWSGGNVLLKYKNEQPFLSEFTAGSGKLYLCASPLAGAASDFARHALFVPVMYKMAALSKPQEHMSYSFGQENVLTEVDNAEKNQVYHLRKGTFDLIPQQQLSDKQLLLELPQTSQTADSQVPDAGYYELVLNGKVQKLLAFNYDKKESETRFYTPTELKNIFAGNKRVQVYESATEKNFVGDFKDRNIGISLWKYCLLAALVFFLGEVLALRFL